MTTTHNTGAMSPLRRSLSRAALSVVAALGACLLAATPAAAHALPVASSPAPGAVLQQPPAAATITFNEAPDPSLSYIQVLDSSGLHHEVGHATSPAGSPRILTVAVANMVRGVYTVAWLTVASDDGHRVSGSFAFGVEVAPLSAVTRTPDFATSALTVPAALARAAFYLSIVFVLGGIAAALFIGFELWQSLRRAIAIAYLIAVAAVIGVTASQLSSAGSSWGQITHTSLFGAFITRLVPALLGAGALLVVGLMPPRLRAPALAVAWGGAALSTLADSAANHASTEANPVVGVGLQWIHIVAAGVWLGGIAALLFVISKIPSERRARILERFAMTSVSCLAVIGISGVLRSLVAIGSWSQLFTTLYGVIILIKVALLLLLAAFGALNRLNARRPNQLLRGFRRIGGGQIVIGAAALVLSAALVNIAPPVLPVYVQPVCPGDGYLWTPGYWAWDGVGGEGDLTLIAGCHGGRRHRP